MLPAIVHYNGYGLNHLNDDWELVCWGDPTTGRIGRIPLAIKIALVYQASMLIWSTGATKTERGVLECEYSFNVAGDRFERLRRDFPIHFEGLLPETKTEYVEWLRRISVFDKQSYDTKTSMAAAVPFIDQALEGRAGIVFTVTSENHGSRVFRDAIVAWKKGLLVEGLHKKSSDRPLTRRVVPLLRPELVTIAVVGADTGYGGKDAVETQVDDLGTLLHVST